MNPKTYKKLVVKQLSRDFRILRKAGLFATANKPAFNNGILYFEDFVNVLGRSQLGVGDHYLIDNGQ
ncbi:MAG: hypothetical protein V7K48_27985 [Nostoc sp.]|uniref:hypothetical protein n=1 Tax=Nostoc sp. TaxID=1180 RepID=UPI002FF4FE31